MRNQECRVDLGFKCCSRETAVQKKKPFYTSICCACKGCITEGYKPSWLNTAIPILLEILRKPQSRNVIILSNSLGNHYMYSEKGNSSSY